MSKRQNQSISGTIQNLIDEGFDLESSIKEITDNSIGAAATNIRFFVDPINLILFVIDNGSGMNKNGLTKLATLNDRKEVSNAKQGKYGQGVKLAFAYLSQLKGLITVVSKSDNYDSSKEDAINQIIIDFPEGIKTDIYNPTGETACTANKNLWEEYAKYIENPNTGTLIKIQMDKRICKELYKKIVTDSLQESIIANVGLINYKFLSDSNNTIRFSTYVVEKNNEPEITLPIEYDITEEDTKDYSEDDNNSGENIKTNQIQLNIQEYNDSFWDAECSEDFHDYDVISFCPIGDLESDEIQKYHCAILQNSVKDINTIVFWNGAWHTISDTNLANLNTKPTNLGSDINDAAKSLKSIIKSEFYINLAHSDNWIETHKDILCYILDCDTSDLPSSSTLKKNQEHSKLSSFIRGNYYSRNNTISLNSRQKARAHTGGDRAKNVFEDNIIALIEYSAKADREFGVTVKKYSTIEEIVDLSIRNVIYFLKKRWATDYNNGLKKEKEERIAKLAAKLAADRKAEEEAKRQSEEEAKRQSEEEAKIKAAIKAQQDAEEEEAKRMADEEAKRKAAIKAQQDAEEEEAKRQSEEKAKIKAAIKAQQDAEEEAERKAKEEAKIKAAIKAQQDAEEEAERKAKEEAERKAKEEEAKIKAQETSRSSNVATYLNKKDMIVALEKWEYSNIHQEELSEVVNYMCTEYKLYTESIVEIILKTLTSHQKIEHLLLEISYKYKSDNDRVSCGAYFIKEYKKYF